MADEVAADAQQTEDAAAVAAGQETQAAQPEAGKGAEGSLAGGGGLDKPEGEAAAGEATEGEEKPTEADWRALAAGDDKDLQKFVKRFGSLNGLAKAALAGRQAASKQGAPGDLAEDATDEERKAWREARGVPEKHDEYDIKLDGVDWSDDDRKDIAVLTERMHKLNAPKAVVKEALQVYRDIEAAKVQEAAVKATNFQKDTIKELQREYGRDFDRNVNLMREFGASKLGAEPWTTFMNTPLMDGTRLGDQPALVRLIVDTALEHGDALPFEGGSGVSGASDADFIAAHKALTAKAHAGDREAKAKMNDPDYDAKVQAAYERQQKRADRAA